MASPELSTRARPVHHRYQEIEVRLGFDLVQELDSEVFRIGQNQDLAGTGTEDIAGQFQQFFGRNRSRSCRCAGGETDRLAGIDIGAKKV